MACDDGELGTDIPAAEIEQLFAELTVCGLDRLADIERDILVALRARPTSLWCAGPYRMLLALHAKAHGRPWTRLLRSGKSEL